MSPPIWGLVGSLSRSPPSPCQVTCQSAAGWNAPLHCIWIWELQQWKIKISGTKRVILQANNTTDGRLSLPSRKHAVLLSVQLVSNDLVVGSDPSLNSCSHEILRDFTLKGSQVIFYNTTWWTARTSKKPEELSGECKHFCCNIINTKLYFFGVIQESHLPLMAATIIRGARNVSFNGIRNIISDFLPLFPYRIVTGHRKEVTIHQLPSGDSKAQ